MSVPETLRIIHEGVKERYFFEVERIKRLDDKASYIMGIASILAALTSGLASLSIKISFGGVNIFLFGTSLILLFAALYFSLRAYQFRTFNIIPDSPTLLGKCEKMSPEQVTEVLIYNYTLATEENSKENEKKIWNIKVATNLIFLSLVFFGMFAIITIATNGGGTFG
jgi:hypothetical protein